MTPNISGSVVTNAEVVWYTGGVSTTPRSLSATQETKKTLLPTVSCVGLWTSDSTKLLYGEIFTLEAERDVSVFTRYEPWFVVCSPPVTWGGSVSTALLTVLIFVHTLDLGNQPK
eukprot:TRINITY_DN5133_c0_g1_i2.p1 TRINITY_DN5133_c0_g1~~TRINITY_DN5133_c0_g1_i2.p1  ORF type:complete len:128 (-),score=10.10 TRINITY_DN5133_c0_g1_i2:154-498(-)